MKRLFLKYSCMRQKLLSFCCTWSPTTSNDQNIALNHMTYFLTRTYVESFLTLLLFYLNVLVNFPSRARLSTGIYLENGFILYNLYNLTNILSLSQIFFRVMFLKRKIYYYKLQYMKAFHSKSFISSAFSFLFVLNTLFKIVYMNIFLANYKTYNIWKIVQELYVFLHKQWFCTIIVAITTKQNIYSGKPGTTLHT